MKSINDCLLAAIDNLDADKVAQLLKLGADPNCKLPPSEFEGEAEYITQPYSPLRKIVFYLGNALNTKADLKRLEKIALLMLYHGADAQDALKLWETLYKTNTNDEKSEYVGVYERVFQAIVKCSKL